MRFIEYMPLDADCAWQREKVLFAREIMETLSREIMPLVPCRQQDRSAPASEFVFADGVGPHRLYRLRQPALLHELQSLPSDRRRQIAKLSVQPRRDRHSRDFARAAAPTTRSLRAVRESIAEKKEGHEINTARFIQPLRPMYSIGG